MAPILTLVEQQKKQYFELMSSSKVGSSYGDDFEHWFHVAMQNPKDGIVVFDGTSLHGGPPYNQDPRGFLHNGNLSWLADY
jgi:hypothetical protein